MRPRVQQVQTADGVSIAYALYGKGAKTPVVAMRPPQFSHLQHEWDMPFSHHEYTEFASDRFVLRFDPRGAGLSAREVADQSLEGRLLDLEAVLAAVGAGRVILDSISSSALTAMAFAARYPERVEKLVIQNAFADGRRWWYEPNRRALLAIAAIQWEVCTETWAWMTWRAPDSTNLRLAEHIRRCITTSDFARMVDAECRIDLRPLLPSLEMPVLVLSHPHFARMVPPGIATDLAAGIPSAQLVTIESTVDRVRAISDFIQGREVVSRAASAPDTSTPARKPALSAREVEVLRLLAQGLTNREIAGRLVISVRTVDTHVESIYRRTNTVSRAAAAAFAIRQRLL